MALHLSREGLNIHDPFGILERVQARRACASSSSDTEACRQTGNPRISISRASAERMSYHSDMSVARPRSASSSPSLQRSDSESPRGREYPREQLPAHLAASRERRARFSFTAASLLTDHPDARSNASVRSVLKSPEVLQTKRHRRVCFVGLRPEDFQDNQHRSVRRLRYGADDGEWE